jgi:sugar/nucleoside kinase (ribokinase family)
MRVLVLGSLVWDTLAGPVEGLEWETTRWVEAMAAGLGGNGGTTAYAFGKLSRGTKHEAALLSVRGDDAAGRWLEERLREVDVDCRFVQTLPGATAATVGVFHPDGRRQLFHHPGVNVDARFALPSGFDYLHVANPFALPFVRRHAAALLAEAKARGMGTSMDLGWDRLGEWGQVVAPCLPFTDLLLANAAEAQWVPGPYPCPAIVKQGAAGCTVDGREVPGFAVEAVDSTGAGDCFCGAYLAAVARGDSMVEAARVANAAGALSVQQAGATGGLLDWKATLDWIAQFRK